MDRRTEAREFLTSRRAKVTPAQAGLPSGGKRRVFGLRRGEVAALDDAERAHPAHLAEPEDGSEERLQLLGSWAATEDTAAQPIDADERRAQDV